MAASGGIVFPKGWPIQENGCPPSMSPARTCRGKCRSKNLQFIEGPVAKIVADILIATGLALAFGDTSPLASHARFKSG
jgi:hypothetical protein